MKLKYFIIFQFLILILVFSNNRALSQDLSAYYESYLNKADSLFFTGDFNGALEFYTMALQIEKSDEEVVKKFEACVLGLGMDPANYYPNEIEVDNCAIYYSFDVSDSLAVILGNFLQSSGFTDSSPKSVFFKLSNDTFSITIITNPEVFDDNTIEYAAQNFINQISENCFNGAVSSLTFLDNNNITLRTFLSQ
ncbi:MAG: hypothetical protein IAE91_01145 [Ignavibacteriaceae bacterium]|nr:hypothetical protein [Ignavibacteriaceae bacterium]